jgi:RNA polymerase sigma-70 factor (ECF subfamily)
MAHNRIDVHQHVVPPLLAKGQPPSQRRSLGHRYSAMVVQERDELHGLPRDCDWDPFADRAERHPLEQTRVTGDGTARQRIHGGSPREANRSLRQLRDPAVNDTLRERHFMNTCGLHDEIDVEPVVPTATDEVLVAAAKLGDRPAFAELWKRHSNTAFKRAFRITKNRDDAEDVIQEAWMKAYVHLKTFDGRAKFSTWLTRIVINSALMTLRRKRARPETSMEITDGETWQHWEIADQRKDVEELYARHERVERLRQAICRLQPNLRNVVQIHQSTDCSVKEIADLEGISVAATKSRLLRARTVLRRVLVERPEMQRRIAQKKY